MVRRGLVVCALAVAGALLFSVPAGAGGGGHCGVPRAPLEDVALTSVGIGDCEFAPAIVRAAAGARITWTNGDSFGHTVTGANELWGTTDALESGESVSHRFEKPGIYPYYCAYHPGMVGAVVVGDGDAASGAAGTAAAPTSGPPASASGFGVRGLVPWLLAAVMFLALAGYVALHRRSAHPAG